MATKLINALQSVDWNKNIAALCAQEALCARIEACNLRIAVWANQIELIEKGNAALPFIREMQHAGHNVACSIGLALYKPAAASMRSLVECALYYTYFRTHPSELQSLVLDEKYYVTKREILIFYSKHVRDFNERQNILGFLEQLENWYSLTSAIVHGQIPGEWSNGASVVEIKHDYEILEKSISHFEKAANLVQNIFLCTISSQIWGFVETDAKIHICKGMPGTIKASLRLDAA